MTKRVEVKCPLCGKEMKFKKVGREEYIEDGPSPPFHVFAFWKMLCPKQFGIGCRLSLF